MFSFIYNGIVVSCLSDLIVFVVLFGTCVHDYSLFWTEESFCLRSVSVQTLVQEKKREPKDDVLHHWLLSFIEGVLSKTGVKRRKQVNDGRKQAKSRLKERIMKRDGHEAILQKY
jgi:hypothetical protein